MYLDVDLESMIKLSENNLLGITDKMIFEEVKKNNYKLEDLHTIMKAKPFLREIVDYELEDEFKSFRKLLCALKLRRRRIHNHNAVNLIWTLFETAPLYDYLNYLKVNDKQLFKLYYEYIKQPANSVEEVVRNHSFNESIAPIDELVSLIEIYVQRDRLDCKLVNSFNYSLNMSFPVELSLLLSYTALQFDYYKDKLIEYCGTIDIDKDEFYDRIYSISRLNNGVLLALSTTRDIFSKMMKTVDDLIISNEHLLSAKEYDNLVIMRDALTKLIVKYI